NELTRKERGDMATMQELFLEEKEMHLLQYMPVSSGVRQHAEERIQQYAQDGDDDNLAMMHSGLPVIEMLMEEYVRKYALPFRICQAKEVLETFIEMAKIDSEGIKDLEQDKGNLEKTRKELKGLRESVEQGEFARSFEEKINCKKVGLSPEAKKQRKELEKKFEDKKKSVQNDLKDSKVTESEGKRAITFALRDSEQLLENIVLGMETMIEDAWVAEKKILDGEYAECVAVFLDQSRFKFPAAKSWGKTVAKLPSTNIWREKFETSIWLTLPFIVLTSGPLYSAVRAFFEKKYTKDDLNEAWKSIEVEISDKFSKNLKAAETNLLDQTKQVRKEYITFVNKNLDMKMKELLRVREDALVSEKKLEEKVHEAEKKLAWLKSFRGKLDAVLSL
ncbi:MAG: hypothetical protein KAH23_03240, partial [Kiritimatiellae bacterium]|nr:hypothetical protein [Kiritimatiellia bacterium]